MTTQFEIDCALMAGLSYQSTRDKINWFPAPSGWVEFSHVPNSTYPTTSGFEASAFQRGTDLVISFAGTYEKDLTGDIAANEWGQTRLSTKLIVSAPIYLHAPSTSSKARRR